MQTWNARGQTAGGTYISISITPTIAVDGAIALVLAGSTTQTISTVVSVSGGLWTAGSAAAAAAAASVVSAPDHPSAVVVAAAVTGTTEAAATAVAAISMALQGEAIRSVFSTAVAGDASVTAGPGTYEPATVSTPSVGAMAAPVVGAATAVGTAATSSVFASTWFAIGIAAAALLTVFALYIYVARNPGAKQIALSKSQPMTANPMLKARLRSHSQSRRPPPPPPLGPAPKHAELSYAELEASQNSIE